MVFGSGIMVDALKHMGTTAWLKEVLKISLSSLTQSFRIRPAVLSGPVVLRGLILDCVLFTLAGARHLLLLLLLCLLIMCGGC